MPTSSTKPAVLIPLGMLAAVIAFWQFPVPRFALMIILLLFSLVLVLFGVIVKYRKQYLQNRLTFVESIRNGFIEIVALLLLMILAGWLGRSIAQFAAQRIDNDLIRFIAGLLTGLLVGIALGTLANQMGRKFSFLRDLIGTRTRS